MRVWLKFIAVLAAGVVVLNLLMFFRQPAMIFFPWPDLEETPADWGLHYEDVDFQAADGVALHGWYVPRQGAQRVVLFLHGNAGNISHRRESIAIFHQLGFNVFIFDYRGYGRSDGEPSEQGLYRDARAAWNHLTEGRGIDASAIVIFGRSLGGAVAARLASEVTAGAVILESTFSSARDVARAAYPLLSRLVVLRYDFNAADAIAGTRSPVLVLHSLDDDIIPFELGQRVFAAAPEPKRFAELRGDHASGFSVSRPYYDRVLEDFLTASFARTP